MTYYIIKPAISNIDTGTAYPQVQKMSSDYNYEAKDSVHALSRTILPIPDFTPNLEYFVLHNQAKFSDLLSVAVIHGGLLVSEKFKKILQQFNLINHQFYTATVANKKERNTYFWLHTKEPLYKYINYSKSSFVVLLNYAHQVGQINITSYEDYLTQKEILKANNEGKTISIWADKIMFDSSFNTNLDLFKIGMFDSNFYVSDRLKHTIEENNITGTLINQATNLLFNF